MNQHLGAGVSFGVGGNVGSREGKIVKKKIGRGGEMDGIPFMAVGNNERENQPPVGMCAQCPNCSKKHVVEYGTDKDGNESKILGFVKCGKALYMVSLAGKRV